MAESKSATRVFRFGIFEIDEATGELRKDGRLQPRLREQPARILVMLLERPRELVRREELRERLWSADTFVDFDHGLNAAINQLRVALGDDPANPRFVQTLPRKGYRFIAPVEISSASASLGSEAKPLEVGATPAVVNEPASPAPELRSTLLANAHDLPDVSGRTALTLFSLIQLMYLTFYVLSLARLPEVRLVLADAGEHARLILVALIVTAAAGIPIRLYLLTAAAFNYRGLGVNFRKLFPFLLPLDELWALAPFLAAQQLGFGLALAVTAALLYLPFAQRSLLLMRDKSRSPAGASPEP
ncbi:MAG TPA: winged helix-turn-helix domain-containing protein [Candidatus Acidoferrales bacterium]|nr:winged helix-turn-helix domain-containing protein [Candidatus Acidoferrales bacterium]